MLNKKKNNRFITLNFIALIVLLTGLGCTGQQARLSHPEAVSDVSGAKQVRAPVESGMDKALWPQEKSELDPDPNIVWGRLDNGFRYALKVNHQPKDRVSVHLNIQAGSINEAETERGLAHFLEHMLFNGTTHFKPGEIVKYFQNIGMQFGPDANAHTGFDETVYRLVLPDGNQETLEKALLVMRDYADGALLLEKEIDRERKVVLAEKRTRDSASYRIREATMNFEFPDSLVSKRLPIGVETVLQSTDRALLKGFYDAWYRPETMVLVMVGDIDVDTTVQLIGRFFGSFEARAPERPKPDMGKIEHSGTKVFYHFEEEIGNASVAIEAVRMTEKPADSLDARKNYLIKDVAEKIVQNRLSEIIRRPGSSLTSAHIRYGRFLEKVEYSEISGKSLPENWEDALETIEKELRKALLFGFTTSELERVRKDMINDLKTDVEKASTRESRALAMEIIRNVNADWVVLSPEQQYDLYVPILQQLDLEQVHQAFKETWGHDHRLVLVTGTAPVDDSAGAPDKHVRNVYEESARVLVAKPQEETPIAFPYLQLAGSPGKIVARNYIEDLGIHQIDFENGLRLNLKRTDFKAKEVLVGLAFGEGRKVEPEDKPGLHYLLSSVINESGLGALTDQELKRALAGKSTETSFDVEEDHFIFRGNTVTEEIPLLFQLLYSHLVDPAFRTEAYMLAMERFESMYASLSRSVDGGMRLAGNRFLAGGDSRFGFPEKERFFSLSLEDVRNWIRPLLENAPLEVSVIGDFQVDSVVSAVADSLGTLSPRQNVSAELRADGPRFPSSKSLDIPVDTQIQKAVVIVAYHTDDFWDIYKTRRLSILSKVLSDRLRETIREKMGAAYTSYAYNRPSRAHRGYGVFQAVVHADPGDTQKVTEEIQKITAELVQNGVERDELQRAIGPTLTSIRELRRKNSYWLGSVLTGSKRHPQKIEWSRTFLKDYSSITPDDLNRLAKRYFVPTQSAEIKIRPLPVAAKL